MKPTTADVNTALRAIASTELPDDHPRRLAAKAIAQYQATAVINPDYDFNQQPRELREIFYGAAVRFSRRRWWSRLLR